MRTRCDVGLGPRDKFIIIYGERKTHTRTHARLVRKKTRQQSFEQRLAAVRHFLFISIVKTVFNFVTLINLSRAFQN